MEHAKLTLNHRLENWVYANAAARTGATGFVAADLGKISYQTDTGQYWRLTATTPTWALIGPLAAPAYAFYQMDPPANPSHTTALTPGVMMGLGVGHQVTPTASGKLLVTIAGTIMNAVANKIPSCGIRWGTGTPPTNGASGATGVGAGGVAALTGNIVNNASPFALSAVIAGAALGVPLWFDLALWTSAGGDAYLLSTTVTVAELP